MHNNFGGSASQEKKKEANPAVGSQFQTFGGFGGFGGFGAPLLVQAKQHKFRVVGTSGAQEISTPIKPGNKTLDIDPRRPRSQEDQKFHLKLRLRRRSLPRELVFLGR